ncbi:MAG: cupredoxin domain-containing protein [Nanoarchaeota archaeon]|nr:cupredoxin domain-containing protein [Nanoarchaeota archaeon]
MKNWFTVVMIILLVVAVGAFLIKTPTISGGAVNEGGSGDIQKITLSYKNYNYYPNTITVKVNEPVRIYLDKSVGGCYRSFTIRDFGISKNLRTPEDYVEFTPTKKGSFVFSCSMGMGTGTLVVE